MSVEANRLAGLKQRIRTLEAELPALAGEQASELLPELARRNRELAQELAELENSLFFLLVNQPKTRFSSEASWKNTGF